MKLKVGVIGTGNWGTTLGLLVANNVKRPNVSKYFEEKVTLWGIEEYHSNELLSTIINLEHVNKKYLSGIRLPENLFCTSEISICADLDIIIVAMPHQFIKKIEDFKGIIKRNCILISVVKGFIDNPDKSITLISTYLKNTFKCKVCVLMGANIATEVAKGSVCEGTLGYEDEESKELSYLLLNSYNYRVTCVKDIPGVELVGSLKNIVALGCGLVEGLGYTGNTKVAIMRNGLMEIRKFLKYFYAESKDETIFQSCGIADLVVSCLEGRNYKYGIMKGKEDTSLEDFEKSMGGQKIQGTGTAEDIFNFLEYKNRTKDFPLFRTIYSIFIENSDPSEILRCISTDSLSDMYK
ncbi:Glycerol-3-phosphate dehydrogenase [NAD+], cytoplasmic [Nosema bombycis CQ1]|uniref:Glycerol-3-phosphate dehydrogenase [NAD(+)] n=1 Tax=Nosema bombycis (strain CQ1 / CVCC 102059) TaxID=578461 RepID=R0KQ40_NOSB1|nr:Glycerol-3-phosphate dehydrogenase [NAD+], cytoplasmic [Nosema bombycis CQ1]|eukprot:EOB12836.1 Glycerol-3-phosphate dehydrogenase [NAD+], cytoplasmic [Nosema bombycis CQ1]